MTFFNDTEMCIRDRDSSERIAHILSIAKTVGQPSDLSDYEIARLFE